METGASDGQSILEDLDYAVDTGLLSSRHKDMKKKMDKLKTTASQIGLKLNTAKTKLMRINYKTYNPITINNINNSDALEDVQMETLQKMPWLESERQVRLSLC